MGSCSSALSVTCKLLGVIFSRASFLITGGVWELSLTVIGSMVVTDLRCPGGVEEVLSPDRALS